MMFPNLCILFFRVLLNIMYLMVETIRQETDEDNAEWRVMRETFRTDLGLEIDSV